MRDSYDEMDELHSALVLLSLDMTGPVFADLGLDPNTAPQVREIARRFVSDWENATPADPWAREDPVWPPIVDAALERIATQLGDDVAAAVVDLARTRQHTNDAWTWSIVLSRIDRPYGRRPLVPLPFDEIANARIATFVATRLHDPERDERLESVGDGPDTEWDFDRRRAYSSDAGESPDYEADNEHPLAIFIQSAATTLATREVLHAIGRDLDTTRRATFVAWGKKQAKALDIPAKEVTVPDWELK